MNKKFEITLPEIVFSSEDIKRKVNSMFSEDFKKEGILAKTFIFLYMNEPLTVTELTERMNSYYKTDLDRIKVYRALNKLISKNIVNNTTTSIVFSMDAEEMNDTHREIVRKHTAFLSNIPKQFKQRFSEVNYYWVANGSGIEYIEWCCELLNINCEKK